jgi:hypothetical protein
LAQQKNEIAHRFIDCADCLDAKMMGQSRLLVLVFACGITSATASAKRGIAKDRNCFFLEL